MKWRALLLVTVLCIPFSSVPADDTKSDDIEFHTAAYSFPCRDKTPKEFAEANPDRKILEVSVRISSVFNIAESEVHRLEYRLKMPESFEICDYLPKTTIGSEIIGQIGVGQQDTSKTMTVVSLDAGAKVGFQIPYVPIEGQVRYEDKDHKETGVHSSVQMSMMPPKQLITAASTQDGGRTLHFKLQQYNQLTLQGDKDFAFLVAVPKDWKGSCVKLECTAFLKASGLAAAQRTLNVGLYKLGDLASKKQIETIVRGEIKGDKIASAEKDSNETVSKKPIRATHKTTKEDLRNYAGKYRVLSYGKYQFVTLNDDGTYSQRIKLLVPFSEMVTGKGGTWHVDNGYLFLKNADLYVDLAIHDFEEKIISFDPVKKRKVIKLENNWTFENVE